MMIKVMSYSGPRAKTIVDQIKDGHGPVEVTELQDVSYKIPECMKCVVCKSQVTNIQIKILPCLHAICSNKCFEKNQNKYGDKCPSCLRVYKNDGQDFMARDFLFELIEDELELGKKSLLDLEFCTYCVRNEKASCWCKDCKLFLCSYCQENHKFQKMTREHVILDKVCGDSTITLPDLEENICKLHDNQPLIMYCKSCEALICSLEKHTEHSDEGLHDIETVQEIVLNYRKTLEDKLVEVKNIADASEEGAKRFLDLERETLTTKRDEYFRQVKQSLNKIYQELIRVEMFIRRNAVDESVVRSKIIKGKGIIYKGLSRRALQYCDYGNVLLQQGSQWSLFRHIYGADAQYEEIKEEYKILSKEITIDDEKALNFHFDESISDEILSKIKSMSKVFYGEKQQMNSLIQRDRAKNSKAINGGAGGSFVKNPHFNKSHSQQINFRQKHQVPQENPIDKSFVSLRPVRGGKEKQISEFVTISVVKVGDNCGGKVSESSDSEKFLTLRKRKTNNDDVINHNPESFEAKPKTRRKQSLNTLKDEPIFVDKTEELNSDNSNWLRNIGSKSTEEVQPTQPQQEILTSKRTPKRAIRWGEEEGDVKAPVLSRHSVKKQTTPPAPSTQPSSSNKRKSRRVSDEQTPHSSSKIPAKRKPGPKPVRPNTHAESDTDEEVESLKVTNDDNNDDFCSVCRDGGDDLICCDVCPRVFHPQCHIPPFDDVPTTDSFQCLFCTELEHVLKIFPDYDTMVKANQMMKKDELQLCFKFLCEIYKIRESRHIFSNFKRLYYAKYRKDATDIDAIRSRLCLGKPEPFEAAKDVVMMLRKVIYQAASCYEKESKEYIGIIQLEKKLEIVVGVYYPELKDLKYTPGGDAETEKK